MAARPSVLQMMQLNIFVDMVAVFGSRVGGIIVSLIFIPIYTQLLSPAEFGAVALLLSLQAFFLVSDLGLATVLARDTAIAQENPEKLAAAVEDRRRGEFLMAALVLLTALLVLVIILVRGDSVFPRDGLRIVLGTAIIALLVLLNITQLCLNALGHYRLSGFLTTSGTIARATGSVLALAYTEASVDVFLWSQLVIAAFHYIVTRAALDRCSKAVSFRLSPLLDRQAFLRLLARCKPVMIYTAGGAAALNLDKSILAAILPIQLTGWYFLAATFAMVPIGILSGPLNQYFAPRVANVEANSGQAARWHLAASFQLLLMPMVILPAFILFRQAPVLAALWLHHAAYAPQVAALAKILLVGTAIGATGYYPTTFLIAVADNIFLARLSLVSAAFVLSLTVAWAMSGSLVGVAVSYAVFHSAGCLAQWLRLRQHWGDAWSRFILPCYVFPATALLAACFVGWGIAAAPFHSATAEKRALIEIALQLVLGTAVMAIAARWCYRLAASLPHPCKS